MDSKAAHYQRILQAIQAAADATALSRAVAPLLQETGFGASGMVDAETGEETRLSYLEIAECLMETDRLFFQKPIELLVMAHQRSKEIMLGVPPRPPEPEAPPPWQQFL
ncbi:hypothetical protein COW36_07335 [bacterium (Candidatus Blackallbacteria) CG17_big_fil_post_rev_8_21_14_2_50_48_46]|uniref:Uncharacterized protein n=1 Tax=bacterium (Candidatus Blackallbacteria) CG17_big_fil_post_rev_8_21_14_2_50_48_46 TaxID=2014261 RepID=A0A2M7G753_9BACT|nr:MAG: hypothetical protein COW64_06845 [bacterium (Candidatus Blackallbacteria) CG18_big_fil_WC_8_21_14_2_50_49_26]PIW17873.1 MAG: hypothetical protein COW36_07335 [bacterium (Candidatus Blackallbacteria) CG17_big_fil_post_rev_8_21_14_2_50_48_46]PIW48549.1 MAG: hypothetical protein COW20_09290 [bacterium (Candidatus Blackallbacteria) CG13_big_fil_rev_8_21_14_2_50_49_14]